MASHQARAHRGRRSPAAPRHAAPLPVQPTQAPAPAPIAAPVPEVAPAPTPAPAPMPGVVPLRFLREVGTVASVYAYWKTEGGCSGMESLYHSALREFARSLVPHDGELGGDDKDAPLANMPGACERCGQARPADVTNRKIFREPLYAAPDGSHVVLPERGDAFYRGHDRTCCPWSNCDGQHLIVVCPDGCEWDTNSRANNCTKKDDRTHRCWIVVGKIEHGDLISVGKDGETCAAGAGSIQTSRYHGMLERSTLRQC